MIRRKITPLQIRFEIPIWRYEMGTFVSNKRTEASKARVEEVPYLTTFNKVINKGQTHQDFDNLYGIYPFLFRNTLFIK